VWGLALEIQFVVTAKIGKTQTTLDDVPDEEDA